MQRETLQLVHEFLGMVETEVQDRHPVRADSYLENTTDDFVSLLRDRVRRVDNALKTGQHKEGGGLRDLFVSDLLGLCGNAALLYSKMQKECE